MTYHKCKEMVGMALGSLLLDKKSKASIGKNTLQHVTRPKKAIDPNFDKSSPKIGRKSTFLIKAL